MLSYASRYLISILILILILFLEPLYDEGLFEKSLVYIPNI
jgi:hypothetical protein